MGKRKTLNLTLLCKHNQNKEAVDVAEASAKVAVAGTEVAEVATEVAVAATEEEVVEVAVQVADSEEEVAAKRNGNHPPNSEDWSRTVKLDHSRKSSDSVSQSKNHRSLTISSNPKTTSSKKKL